MHYRFIVKVFLSCTLLAQVSATPSHYTATFITEETVNGTAFKQILDINNGLKKESYFIQNKPVSASEYEDAVLSAEKEASKKTRKKAQEERIRMYETQYKGHVKIAQSELKQALISLESELVNTLDERLAPYILYTTSTVSSADQLKNIKENVIPDAKKLIESSPEMMDIKKIQEALAHVQSLTQRVHETFITAVNNGINKADDTKLLKELLTIVQ